ncbi:hypothetical protein [Paenibacillus shirakamiensis]|uniref:hypothetical protein n=1 Tax=Paenibacillus shirakamiensis TaxID=1265935 RepID=UPI001AE915B0|nr:hypothetical protein [Paenibacillus shirakamiensis]
MVLVVTPELTDAPLLCFSIIFSLLVLGCNKSDELNKLDSNGSTFLFDKILAGATYDEIKELIDSGAKVYIYDSGNQTPFTLAVKAMPENIQILKLLLNSGAYKHTKLRRVH